MTGGQLKRLGHVSLATNRLEEMITFYQGVLGAQVAHDFRNAEGVRYGAFLTTGCGSFIELFNSSDEPIPGNRFRHLCLEVENIEALARHLQTHGYSAKIKRGKTDRILQFFITAPDGTMIEFQQHDEQSTLAPFLSRAITQEIP